MSNNEYNEEYSNNYSNEEEGQGETFELHDAVEYGSLEDVKKVLLENPDIDVNEQLPNDGATPLHIAAGMGDTKKVEELLAHPKIDVNSGMKRGTTPLYIAAQQGRDAVVHILLQKEGINVNQARTIEPYNTPLFIALFNQRTKVVEELLKHPEINVNTPEMYPPLWTAVNMRDSNSVRLLLRNAKDKIDVNKGLDGGAGEPPLYRAAHNGDLEIVKELLAHPKIDVNKPDRADRQTPLFAAASKGHLEIVKALLDRADINLHIANRTGVTAYKLASEGKFNPAINQLILSYGVPAAGAAASNNTVGGARRARKSRKAVRKAVRKSRKAVRKSRKAVRKSRKAVRKSRKAVRKSRKAVRKIRK
jgi:ankyrin repeat protein